MTAGLSTRTLKACRLPPTSASRHFAHLNGIAAQQRRAYHVALVGSGPGAFYTTKFLFKKGGDSINVDMYERLPTPFGLVRFGVAPDHPEVKNVVNDFTAVAGNQRFRFFGNVEVGKDVSLDLLEKSYDAVVVCTGAQGERKLGIPGEDSPGVLGAPAFVKWYNGHPDHQSVIEELPESVGSGIAVVGNGNVALDVARLLLKEPTELRETDMCDAAIDRIAMWQSKGLRTVHVLGRRGVVQAAFTNKELRELLDINGVLPVVDPTDLRLSRNAASEKELTTNRPKKRSMDIIDKMVANFAERETTSKRVLWLRFLAAPTELSVGSAGSCSSLRWQRTELFGEAGKQSVRVSESTAPQEIECGLVVRSVGFDLIEMAGVPIDARNRIPHTSGKVDAGEDRWLYVAGWAKRGPQGVIASNIPDAQETATTLWTDLSSRSPRAQLGPVEEAIKASSAQVVSFSDWLKLQAQEQEAGAMEQRPARKLTSIDDMLKILR